MTFIQIIGITLLAAFAGWMSYLPANAIRTGIAHRAGASHKRRKDPVQFWITVGGQTVIALILLSLLAARIVEIVARYSAAR